MHGTLPLSEAQALASLRDGTVAHTSVAALAREWGWTRSTVRHRLERWRKAGDLPPVSKQRSTRRKFPAKEAPSSLPPLSRLLLPRLSRHRFLHPFPQPCLRRSPPCLPLS